MEVPQVSNCHFLFYIRERDFQFFVMLYELILAGRTNSITAKEKITDATEP